MSLNTCSVNCAKSTASSRQVPSLGRSAGCEPLGDAAGQAEDRMDHLAAEIRDQFAHPPAHRDDLFPDLDAHLADHADDVALGLGRVRADDEIRAAEDVDVQRVVLEHERVVDELADLLRGRRAARRGTGRPAPSLPPCGAPSGRRRRCARDLGHVLGGPAEGEHLEPAQFGDL